VAGKRGYYVKPAIVVSAEELSAGDEEIFSPVASIESFETFSEAAARQGVTHFGLTASVFTSSEKTFRATGEYLEVGNLYWNLPTTFSPSTLPFGGFRASGNGKPGARGFMRFAADEQAVQWSV
jgi:acyl-CoA reductase-like NAD-dependent aldehyde dehydrogenase